LCDSQGEVHFEGEKEVEVTEVYYGHYYFKPPIEGINNFDENYGDTYKLPNKPKNPFGNLIIHTPTKEDWIKVCEKIERESDLRWGDEKPTEFENWGCYRETSVIKADKDLEYCYLGFHKNDLEYQNYKFITAKEFLEEEEWEMSYMAYPNLNNLTIKEITMSIVKNALMSKESKAVKELGLGENKNNLNRDGLMEFLEFLWTKADKKDKAEFLKILVERNS
jgi:hypothetical protein